MFFSPIFLLKADPTIFFWYQRNLVRTQLLKNSKFFLKLFGDVARWGKIFALLETKGQKPLKIDAWTMKFPFWHGLFSGVLLVSGRVHGHPWKSCLPRGIIGPPHVPRRNEGSVKAHPSSDVAGKRRFEWYS